MATKKKSAAKKTAPKKTSTKKATTPSSTSSAALENMRALCLALPNVTEGKHSGSVAFLVGKKMFATYGDKKGKAEIVLGFPEKRVQELLAAGKWRKYPFDKRALAIDAADVDDWGAMKKLVEESYLLIVER